LRLEAVKTRLLVAGLIVLAVLAAQGPSLRHGFLLDDYSHRAELQENGWSYRGLVDAAHLGQPRRSLSLWWHRPSDLFFYRPLAFLLMRVEYVLGDWRAGPMHAFNLAWHAGCAMLVAELAWWCIGRWFWAGVAGVFFALHPANFLTVRWIACQSQLMAVGFLLLATLCYARYSGWTRAFVPCEDRTPRLPASGGTVLWLFLSALFFAAALGCRENAVVFVALMMAGDAFLRPRRWAGRWKAYGLLVAILVVYLAVRHAALGGFPWPSRPYAHPPGEPGFVRFVWDKLLYYLLALFAYVPVVGFAGLRFLREHAWAFYGASAVLAGAWIVVVLTFWRRRNAVFWLVWAVVPLLPVLPVFASGHHLYLACVGMVILTVSSWARAEQIAARFRPGVRRAVGIALPVLMGLHLAAFGVANVLYNHGLAALAATSQLVVDDVASTAPDLRAHQKLFFINLPLLGYNCIPGIESATGVQPLKGYVLTFATSFFRMEEPCRIEQIDAHSFRVRLARDGYFAGQLGESLLQAAGRSSMFRPGEQFASDDGEFRVRVERGSARGVRELLFRFRQPLRSEQYRFFLGSRIRAAYPLSFEPVP